MKRAVILGIWLALLLLRVGTLQGQSYTMTDGQTFITCSGTFYDPGGPDGNYDNSLDYMQTFISASPDMCLKVTFTSFVTESGFDKLYVYDGDTVSGTLIDAYSGTNNPFSVISSTGVLTFLFHSDYSVTKSGWEATISCVECSLPPPIEPYYSMHHGTDTIDCLSPPRPFYDPGGIVGDYSSNSHYVQTFVSSDPNRCLTVTFTDFATEMYLDKLFVYDGDSPSGIILGVYTGYLGGFSVTSVTGALTFVFDSDSSYNETGWVATVSCSDCDDPPGPTNNMHYGTDTIYCSQAPRPFYDPGGPNGDYDDHLDYVQTFVSSEPDSCLQVTFTSIDIADWNGLYVYDGTSTSGTLLGVLTGIDSNVTIVSTTGALTFQFLPYYGFGAGWEAVISCTSCPPPPPPPPPPPSSPCSPDGIHPFCTDENPYGVTYASGTSGENASSFLGSSQYSCLYSTPNPAWYYMQIDDPGDLLIYIQQVSATGTGLDVDFVCWGPFVASSQNDFVNKLCNGDYTLDTYTNGSHRPTDGNHQNDMGGYPGGNVIDCSYSAQSTEWCFIPNTQHGEWYLFLITNYSGHTGTITYSVVNEYSTATTNCNLLAPITANDPLCDGDTLVLTCMEPLAGATYHWSGPGGWTATTDVPYVTIAGIHANQSGQYTLHITGVGSNVDSSQVDVTIHAMPQVTVTVSADTVCEGTSVTLQAGGATNYQWSPTSSTGSSITVTPESTTTYTVVGTTNGCADTVVRQVTVLQNTTGDTSVVACGSFDWYGETLSESGPYNHTFTNAMGCDSVVTLHLSVGSMPEISIIPSHDMICEGTSVTLNATPSNDFSYLWNNGATTAMIVETPGQTTEYSVTVTDIYGCKDSVSVTITVGENSEQTLYDTVCQGKAYAGYGFTLTAAETNTPGTLTLSHTDTDDYGCISTTILALTVYESPHDTITQTTCDSFVWHGTTYNLSGYYTDTLQMVNGCDSLVTLHLTVGQAPDIQITTSPSPATVCAGEEITLTAVTECGSSDTILYEGFDGLPYGNIGQTQTDNGPGSTELTFPSDELTDAFISGVKVFPAGDAVKMGSSSAVGSITSNYLDLSQDFIVTIRAKGWIFSGTSKNTKIRVSTNSGNAQEITVPGNSDFTDYSFAFSAAGDSAQLTIETVNASGFDKRAFIDYVRITRDVPCSYYWYTATDAISSETEITVVPSSTGWYYFSATSPLGCEGADSVEVVVNTPEHQAYTTTQCESYTWHGTNYTESGHYTYSHEDVNGCLQVDTLHLTIDSYAAGTDVQTACGSFEWIDGNTYTQSNNTATYTISGGAANGCDSVVTLDLTIHNPVHTAVTETACESYTWHGTTYTQSGTYMYSHEDANGCQQVDTLHLTIDSHTVGTDVQTACGSFEWIDGNTYTQSNNTATYTIAGGAANGCDSVVTLDLTIHNPVHTSVTETACESYIWHGTTYTQSGTYMYSHEDANGCQQVDTLHLTIDNYTAGTDVQTACGSFEWIDGNTYTESNHTATYTIAGGAANGCDSVVTLDLTINNPTHTAVTVAECGSYTWTDGNGQTYTSSGDYLYPHEDENGCLQVDTLHLTITGGESYELYVTECENYPWYDDDILMEIYTSSGVYTKNFTNAAGCDSVVTLHLTILTPAYTEETVTECVSYTWNDSTYTTSGDYDWIGTGVNGCDSTATLHLTITGSEPTEIYATECENYQWFHGDILIDFYMSSGDYTQTFTNAAGCDSVVTLHLTILTPAYTEETVTECVSYTWNDSTYTSSGDYDWIGTGVNGCDSTATLHLTILTPIFSADTVTECVSYTWNETTYNTSGDYDWMGTGANGCDSTATLHLTILHPEHQSFTETAYDSYTWTDGSGYTYVQSGTYQCQHPDSNGCLQVDTLHLTVFYSSANVFAATACESYEWDGETYTQSGTYVRQYFDIHNADSTVTLHLIVNHGTHNVDTVNACDSYVWHDSTYTSDGVYVYEYTNGEGCPSADTLYLTVGTTPDVIVSGPHLFCPDSSVTLTAVTETPPESYLWSNGATTASITVSDAGIYAVTAYYAGGCSAVSADFHVFETENPIVDGFLNDMVAGDTQMVVIGTVEGDNLQYAIPQSTLTYSTVTFLPDGVPCEPLGCSYKAEMSFSGFPDTAVVHSADEIRYIRLNMEHSAPIDLYIRLECPNGQQADILRKYDDDSQSECLSFIDSSHIGWPDGNVNQVYYDQYPFIKPWIGQPNILSYNADHRCDPAWNLPGVGWNYCWSDNTTEGYQYASANGCLVDTSNSIYYYSGNIQNIYHLYRIIIDSSNVAAGTQYYHPDESFDSLIGCPINGVWTVEVIDGITIDNGYIFECELGVAEHLSATHYAHVSEMFFDGLWTGAGGSDSTFVITPPGDLANDTVVAYTFTLIDENGCTFDTVIYIHVYAHKHIDLYDTVNASELPFVWEGLTFYNAGCQDTLLHTVHGADSVVTLHLSVIYHYDTAVCANKTPLLWHNQTFYSTSSVTVSQSVQSGCADSIEALLVKVNPVFRDTLPMVICATEAPFLWRGGSYSATGTYYDSLVSVVTGCDSIYVLKLTVNPTFVVPLTAAICEGDTFQFFGQLLTEEGVYSETLQTVHGCDSVVTLTLTVHPIYSTSLADTICEGDTFHFFSQHLTETGVYTETLQTVHGCDSVFTLNLTVHPTYSIALLDTICQGDTFLFFGQPLTEEGVYTETLQTVQGCDSVYTLNLTVNPTYSIPLADTICQGDTFHFFSQSLTEAGVYTETLQTVHGCDSVFILNLTVHPTYSILLTDTICQGDTVHFFDQLLTETGVYTETLQTVHGCDSVFILNLTVHPTYSIPLMDTICQGDTFLFFGQTLTEEGVYTETLQTVYGCDSIFTLNLTVHPTYSIPLADTICQGDTFHFFSQHLTETGVYTDTLQTVHGCDSVFTLSLTVHPTYSIPLVDTICEGDTLFFFDQLLTETGVYTETLQTVHGCDSIIELSLTVNEIFHGVTDTVICESDTPFVWRGNGYSVTGSYSDTLSVPPSCDSIFILNLTVHQITFADTFATACDSFVWRGVTYHETPAFLPTDTLVGGNAGGCDSVTVLHLTIHHSTARSDTVGICEGELPYIYGDTLFEAGTVSGIYVLHDTTVYGCDSMVTLHLQVSPNTYKFRAATICESMLPAVWEGHTWTGEGTIIDTFPASNGCDSIVTKTLTVGVTTDTTIVDTVVENQLPYVLDGVEYYATGIYHDTTMNMAACDSIITLDLTVFFNVTTTLDSTICDNLLPLNWNGVLFGEADTQSVVLAAATGADSTVVMRLHVNETPQVSISGPTVFCLGDSVELTAVSTPVTAYLWSTGDATESVTIHTAGTYTVTVTNEYNCTATDSLSVSESFIVNPIASHPFPDMCVGEEYLYEIPGLVPTALSVTVDGLWVTAASDTSFLFSPPVTLAHDTAVAYTFHFQNQYGCSYDTTVYSNVYVQNHTVIDTTVCNSFVWNGVTYTQSDTITLHTPNIHGCDSVVTVHLVVNHSSVSYDTLHLVENQLPYYFEPSDTLFAVGSPSAFQFTYAIPIQGECDSTVIEQVYVYMNYFHAFDTMVCSSALPLTWHGHTFTGAGTVTDALFTVHGSDSILVYTVNVDALSATIGSVTHINCYGESTGAATATVTGGVTPLAYQWTNASGSMVSVTTQISNRPAGDYTFTVTDGAGCTATQTVTLNTLHGQMQPGTISGPGALCYGETLGTVSGTAATGDDCVYQWQISSNGTSWSPATGVNNTQNYTSTEVFSEVFMLRRAWISGACGTLYSNILTVNVWPVSSDTIHDAICAGEPYQQHGFDIPATETVGQTELTVVDSLTNSYGCDSLVTLMLTIFESQETVIQAEVCEGDGYHLDGFNVSASETVGADTLLRILNYQTVEGCDSVVRLEVSVIDTALRIESLTADFCDEMMAELVVVTNLPDYEWSTGEQLPNITVIAPGVYNVTASQGGCSVTARYVVEPCVIELYLPNAISPSREDGLNDYFGISEYAQRIINMFEISIFNRWGEMVFHSTDKGFRWNGEYKGKIYHQNVYNYVIHYTDSAGRPFRVTGSVTVL